jgi:RyR domain-containing protein
VLLGTGRLAQALLLEAARWWHFGAPESQLTSDLRIRVVASDAEAVCAAFRSRYPASTRTVSLEPLALDPLQPADVDAIPVAPPATPWGAYVCVDADDAYRLMVADRYGARVGDRHDGAIVVAISALGVASEAPTAQLSLTVPDRPPIVGLGVDDRGGLDVEHLGRTEALARTIHGDYEGFMRDKGWTDAPALAPFDSLEERFRESNRRQARDFDAQLTACLLRTTRLVDWDRVKDFDPAAVEVMAALEHASWVDERLVGGWHLGPVRDDDAKQHPDIVDWSALADARREIDREFIRRRPHVLARIGEQAVPHPARAVLARLLHERYRTTTGDERGWDALPDEDRAASLAFVDAIPTKLLMIGRHIVERDGESPLHALREDEIELLAQAEHERWAAFRARRGWRLGSRRDESARAHPDLLPWSELPDDVREIDRELIRAMPASLEVVGLATRRIPTVPGPASSHRPS